MIFACTVILVAFVSYCLAEEPHCSKYDFEEKVLKKLIRMEFDAERMKSEVDESLKKIETLNSEVKGSINDFHVSIAETIKGVRDNVSEVLAGLDVKFSALEQKMLSTLLDEQQKKLIEIAAEHKPNPTIAFSSQNPDKLTPQNGKPIVFNTTLMNHGGGYNNTTGVFTAPSDGVYWFTTQFCVYIRGSIYYQIMHNGTSIKKSRIQTRYNDICTSSDAILVMKLSDRVWVEWESSSLVLDETGEGLNTFSGAMIH